jgi:tRNA threonylcarbamoyladenosine biosynthesis protein TsaB
MVLTLTLDAALSACSAALVRDGLVIAQRGAAGGHGQAAILPSMAEEMLGLGTPDIVAVTVGPGSFTGLRLALSLAHGIALGRGCQLVAVSLGEVFAQALPGLGARLGKRTLWTAIDSRRDHVFLEIGGAVRSVMAEQILVPAEPVAMAGDAAADVASWLAARGADVMLTDIRAVSPGLIAQAAHRRLSGALPARSAVPVYVEPPSTRPPGRAPRPRPV